MYPDGNGENTMSDHESARPTIGRLFAFFVPLGLSASLVTVSHVIINSTLARSDHPEIVISSYAIGLSMIGIIERPGVLLRQTCSALVRDRVSFRAISWIALYLFVGMMAVGGAISYTPLGEWLFLYAFGVNPELLPAIIDVYRVLMFVAVFSGLRCLFHGIIISHLRTKWLTIGMIVRLVAMYLLSLYYIRTGVHSGTVGAIIFLTGMIIEALVAVWEGTKLLRTLPKKKEGYPVERMTDILPFYRPLFFSSLIVVTVSPLINAMLGKTVNVDLAI
jgi:Na+-driven multidrug efflux pump